MALAQINRAGANGAGREHLKGAGEIEQEADQIMILEAQPNDPAMIDLNLDKNRHGPTGQIQLFFEQKYLSFNLR